MSFVKVKDLASDKTVFDSHKETIKEAIKKFQEKEKREMTNLPAKRESTFTPEELNLIKTTIAKGATDDELKLFLYRAKVLELDPLKPGQIYFVKYGSNPGTIMVGIEGFRSKAARTGKHTGTQRGVIKDEHGKCIGAWCEVSRSDWSRPAREEVSLHEYNTGKSNWAKMPETMIKKVAEAAALRMAFPDDLGGIYEPAEMDQAAKEAYQRENLIRAGQNGDVNTLAPPPMPMKNPGEYIINFGRKYKDRKIKDIDSIELEGFIKWCIDEASKHGRPLSHDANLLRINFSAYIDECAENMPIEGQQSFEESEDESF